MLVCRGSEVRVNGIVLYFASLNQFGKSVFCLCTLAVVIGKEASHHCCTVKPPGCGGSFSSASATWMWCHPSMQPTSRYERESQTSRSRHRMLACIVELVLAGLCCRMRDWIRVESSPVSNFPIFSLNRLLSVLSQSGSISCRMSFVEMACLCYWKFGLRPFHHWRVSR